MIIVVQEVALVDGEVLVLLLDFEDFDDEVLEDDEALENGNNILQILFFYFLFMKKTLVVLAVIIALWFSLFSFISWKYNNLVTKEEVVNTAWAQVENQYQRRFDLIPNIVASVKWEANFEKSTLEAVVQARASATKTNIDINDAKDFAEYQKEQSWISQALSRLLMVTENYPNLKANQRFADLRISLEWTENRISTERMRYNEVVQDFNIFLRTFPNNLLAWFFWFEKKNLFESDAWASVAPKVDFEK